MVWKSETPERIRSFIESGVVAEFATVSGAGVPIDTPTFYFPSDDLATIDLATSLVNPAKAERVRRNPKVGMMIAGSAEEPVIAIRGYAAIRDNDFEANAVRYISETGFESVGAGVTWELARQEVQYWTRIIIEVTPVELMWWDNVAAMGGPPQCWNAPSDTVLPQSDPTPPGRQSPGSWPARDWRDVVQQATALRRMPHLAVCDEGGHPMPAPVLRYEFRDDGFRLTMPAGVPWRTEGKGTLSFDGHVIFVGGAVPEDGAIFFTVERVLPQNQATQSSSSVLKLNEDMKRIRQKRLDEELGRRGKSIPKIPLVEPPRTRMARLREERIRSGVPIAGFPSAR